MIKRNIIIFEFDSLYQILSEINDFLMLKINSHSQKSIDLNKVDDEINAVNVQDCSIKYCSVGVCINESFQHGETSVQKEKTTQNQ